MGVTIKEGQDYNWAHQSDIEPDMPPGTDCPYPIRILAFLRWYGRITLWYGFEAKYWKTIDELCVAKQNSFIVDTTSFLRKFKKNGRFRPPWMTIDL